jgi:membrane protease YdiL (CAAX protease family)
LLIVLASIVYLWLRCWPDIGDLGFLPWRPRYDLRLGVWTFIAALAPVFAIQYLLTRWIKSEHPVQLLLSENSSPRVLLLCFLSAVLVAPLTEEFLFRVLLQGWMEAVAIRWRREPAPDSSVMSDADGPDQSAALPAGGENPYAAPLQSSLPLAPTTGPTARLMPGPIILSSLAFALVHLGHGPDPIPLFVFALLLGYLYQKTHRIWPSLVVHACLNAWSLIMLWLNLKLGLGE